MYKTTEKSDQNEFIAKYLNVTTPKRRYGKSEVARVMTVAYKIPKLGAEELFVCRSMFFAVTGMLEKRIKGVTEKLFKKYLMEHGESGMFDTGRKRESVEKKEKFKQLLSEKTERILSLEKGSFEVFSKVVIGTTSKEAADKSMDQSKSAKRPRTIPEKSKKKYKSKSKSDDESFDYDENLSFDLPDSISDSENVKRNLLELDSLEVCRVCLQNKGRLKAIFGKGKSKMKRVPEMIEFCFAVQVLCSLYLINKSLKSLIYFRSKETMACPRRSAKNVTRISKFLTILKSLSWNLRISWKLVLKNPKFVLSKT